MGRLLVDKRDDMIEQWRVAQSIEARERLWVQVQIYDELVEWLANV